MWVAKKNSPLSWTRFRVCCRRWLGPVTPEVALEDESDIPHTLKNVLEVLAVDGGEALGLFLDTEGANFLRVVPAIREDGREVVVAVDAE